MIKVHYLMVTPLDIVAHLMMTTLDMVHYLMATLDYGILPNGDYFRYGALPGAGYL